VSNNKAIKMSEILLVKYLFKKDWSPLEEIVDRYSKEFGDIYDVSNDKELVQVVTSSSATIVIASVTSKEDLTLILTFLKTQRKLMKDGNLKVSVVNYLDNKQVEAALMKLGCQEVIDPNMKSKALKFKMDFWKKALSAGVNKANENLNAALKEKAASEAKQQKSSDPKTAELKAIVWNEPLKHVDDMWINKSQNDVKKILSRWMIKFMGPSPYVAQWTEVPGKRGLWKFVFKEGTRESFHMADGEWYFSGEHKPDFVWKENLWLVSGQKFQLYYREDDETIVRFQANPKTIEVSKNSNYALSREKLILETFDQEVLVKKGMLDKGKTEIEQDEDASGGLLEQELNGTDRLSSHYHGEGKTSDLGSANYSGKVNNQNETDNKNKRHSSGIEFLENQEGDAGTDDFGSDKYKGLTEYKKSDRKSHYGGKSETDDLGDGHWSNDNEASKRSSKKNRKDAYDDTNEDYSDTDLYEKKKIHPLDAKRKNYSKEESSSSDRDEEESKVQKSNRETAVDHSSARDKKMYIMDDLLPDGNAEDPQKEVLPQDFGILDRADASPLSRSKPRLVEPQNNERELTESTELSKEERDRAAKKVQGLVPSLLDEAPSNDEGKPVVNADATIKVILRTKAMPQVERIIRLDDFFDDTAIVQMDNQGLKVGEEVELMLTFDYMNRNKKITISGICSESDGDDTDEIFCTLKIENDHLKMFEQFMLLYQLRQQHIHHFIKTAKGF
jgi:hypothetical protein